MMIDQEAENGEHLRDGLEPDTYPVPVGWWQRMKHTEAWRSVFRHPQLDTPRGRALQGFSNVFLHLYPVRCRAAYFVCAIRGGWVTSPPCCLQCWW